MRTEPFVLGRPRGIYREMSSQDPTLLKIKSHLRSHLSSLLLMVRVKLEESCLVSVLSERIYVPMELYISDKPPGVSASIQITAE